VWQSRRQPSSYPPPWKPEISWTENCLNSKHNDYKKLMVISLQAWSYQNQHFTTKDPYFTSALFRAGSLLILLKS
jgi:hypothetical protein